MWQSGLATFSSLLVSAMLFVPSSGAASMKGDTIFGQTDDPRILGCGVRMSGSQWIELTPFIETVGGFAGNIDLTVTKISKSGTSRIHQSNRITTGTVQLSTVRTDQPERLGIEMNVRDDAGMIVCRVTDRIVLGAPDIAP